MPATDGLLNLRPSDGRVRPGIQPGPELDSHAVSYAFKYSATVRSQEKSAFIPFWR